MAAIWTWVRAELRRDLRSSIAVVLIIGLGAGVAMAAVAGARRTDTAFDRFLDTSRAATHRVQYSSDDDVDDLVLERLRAHPDVEVAVPIHFLIAFSESTEYDLGIITSSDPAFGHTVDRLRMVEGRRPMDDSIDEVMVSRFLSEETGVGVGDTLTLGTFSAEQIDQGDFGSEPAGPVLDVEVVGIGYTPDELADEESGFLYASPAFADAHVGVVGGFGPSIELRLRDGADVEDVTSSAFAGLDLVEAPIVESAEMRADRVGDTTGALSTALLLFAACAAVAAAVAAGQALTRRLATAAVDQPILEAVGVTRSQRAAALASLAVPHVAVGAGVALVVAIAGSTTMPPGLAGRAEPDPGVDVDVLVLVLGTVSAGLFLLGLAVLAAHGLASARAIADRERSLVGRSAVVGVAKRAGWSAPAVVGITMALEPGRGRTAVPVRPALIGAVVGTAGVVAALTFGASLDHLTSTPAAYGWNWGLSPDLFDEDAELLAEQEEVEDVGQLFLQQVVVDGRQLQGMSVSSLKGDPSLTLLEGRMPASIGEVALGPVTADRAGASIGDRVVVEGPGGEIEVTVVGRALFPVFDENPFNDAVAFHPDLLGEVAVSEGFGASIVSFRPGVSREEGAALVDELVPEAMTIYAVPTRPPDVENLTQVRGMPRLLAVFLVLLAVAAVGHALVTAARRRRRDLGVLRAIGFRRHQVATAVAVQSLTLVAVGLVLGIPFGVIAGRVAWSLVADGIGVASTITVPGLALAVLVPAALMLAALLAVLPARSASTVTPAEALRTE